MEKDILDTLREKISDGLIKKEEFIKVMTTFTGILREMRVSNERMLDERKKENPVYITEYINKFKSIEAEVKKLLSDFKVSDKKEIDNLKTLFLKETKRLESLIPDKTDLAPLERKIEASILELETKIAQLLEELKAEKIRDKLETLKGDERLDKSAIKDLDEELKRLEGLIGSGGGGVGRTFGGMRKVFWQQKDLVGDIDGVNKTFTFQGKAPAEFSERIFLNYIEQNPLTDYTISGNTVIYTVAPDASLAGLPHIIRSAY